MAYEYDDQNIFAKILRGEIPNTTVLETKHSLAFRDIQAQAPEHILVIPKGAYVCFDHFANSASVEEIVDFTRAVGQVATALKVDPGTGGDGYRLLANSGQHGVQEVPHLHVHLVAGRPPVIHPSLAATLHGNVMWSLAILMRPLQHRVCKWLSASFALAAIQVSR